MSLYRAAKPVKYTRCKYCGARLKRDSIGQRCGTRNCKWQYGLPTSDDSPTKKKSNPAP